MKLSNKPRVSPLGVLKTMPPLPDGVVAVEGVEVPSVQLMNVHLLKGSRPYVVGAVGSDCSEVAM